MARNATHESFILIAPTLKHEAAAIIERLKEVGLTLQQRLEIRLSPREGEQLLSSITEHLRQREPDVPAEEIRARKFGLATSRAFGSESFTHVAAIPSHEEVEVYTSETPLALIVGAVDPRINVVQRLQQLVGPDTAADVHSSKGCLREVYDARAHARVWRCSAPREPGAARRGLDLLKRLQDAASGRAGRPASRDGQSTPSRASRRASLSLTMSSHGHGHGGNSVGGMGLLASLTLSGPFPLGTTQGKSAHIDVDQLLDFVFPPAQQWPASTGRLILYALYGPLTATGGLNGGRRVGRNLTEAEISAMISEIETDDMLAVYSAGSVLGDISSLLTAVRAPSRRLPNMSRNQAIDMLADLPRDSAGRLSFHDVQQRVLRARTGRVKELGKMFPDVISRRDPEVARLSLAPAPLAYGKGTLARRLHEEAGLGEAIAAGGEAAAAATVGLGSFKALMASKETFSRSLHARSASAPVLALAESAQAAGVGLNASQRVGLGVGTGAASLFPAVTTLDRRSARASAPNAHGVQTGVLAPSESSMGGIDTSVKRGDVQRAREIERLLHRNISIVSSVADKGSGVETAAKASAMIMRADVPSALDGFNRFAPLGLHKPAGTAVPGSLNRTMVTL